MNLDGKNREKYLGIRNRTKKKDQSTEQENIEGLEKKAIVIKSAGRPRPSQSCQLIHVPIEILLKITMFFTSFDIYRLSLSCHTLMIKMRESPVFWLNFNWNQELLKKMNNKDLERILSLDQGLAKTLQLTSLRNITSIHFMINHRHCSSQFI